jgi:hypothetical protein
MEYDRDKVDEMVLALLWLTPAGDGRAWKGHDWDALDRFNKWIRRRIRSAACKQWRTGKTRYARLRELGLSHDLAARTAGHQWGPWRLSRTEALSYAMPAAYFDRLGLPSLRCTSGA